MFLLILFYIVMIIFTALLIFRKEYFEDCDYLFSIFLGLFWVITLPVFLLCSVVKFLNHKIDEIF